MGGLCPKEDQPEQGQEAKEENQASQEAKQDAAESKPAEEKPAEEKPAEEKPADSKPAEEPDKNGGDDGDNAPEPAEEKEEPKSGDADDGAKVVTRKEIRSLSEAEAKRFFDAVDKTLESKSGPGTSEFFRCASYHGQPPPIYCQHGRETFPGWHRIYLMDFEKALQAADRALGNDGNVALHYWDWSVRPEDGLPKIVRERFNGWPDDFWPDSLKQERHTQALRRASDRSITSQLRSWGVGQEAYDCLLATQHWVHASTQFSGAYPSIESPHNSVHVIVGGNGGQMGGVAWAAFDLAFWLHHCNVDRIYESYLAIEPDSAQEFENFQDNQQVDMFDADFEPFTKPDGSKYRPKDTFDTAALGYKYDDLLKAPSQNQLREAPTFILFSQVKVYEFESKCYQIHAFVVDKDKEDEFKEPATVDDIDYESANYAGGAGIFGRGMECQNCVNRPPQDIVIDITRNLRELGVSRYNVSVKVYVLETTEDTPNFLPLSETPLPEPVVTGPLFVNTDGDAMLDEEDKATNDANEVAALQRYLQKFGYYAPERKVDGDYGEYTAQAVRDFQTATGDLEVDAVAGPKTRGAIVRKKRCDNVDPFAKNEVVDKEVNFAEATYAKSKEIKYFVGVQPGYLKRADVEACIQRACAQYADNCPLTFTAVTDENEADIKFKWMMFNREDDPLRYDGSGGVLGRGGNGYVEFDTAERWVIGQGDDEKQLSDLQDKSTWYRGQPTISLYYTALHELGHALGLVHSMNANDVMSPWYNPAQQELSKEDVENLQKIVNAE